jgi:hypothetical protein
VAAVIELVLGLVVAGFLAMLLFGLATGRINWRAEGCCAPPAERDARLRSREE